MSSEIEIDAELSNRNFKPDSLSSLDLLNSKEACADLPVSSDLPENRLIW